MQFQECLAMISAARLPPGQASASPVLLKDQKWQQLATAILTGAWRRGPRGKAGCCLQKKKMLLLTCIGAHPLLELF